MTTDPRQLAALIHAQETIASAGLEVGDVLVSLAGHARELTGASGAVVELVDPEGMVVQGAADNSSVLVGVRMPDVTASARAVLQRRLVRWDEPNGATGAAGEGRGDAKSVIAAPLAVEEDEVVGVVTVVQSKAEAFTSDDEHCLRVVARFASHQIVQARRLASAERTSRLDPLTQLGNRRALDEALQRELARHIRYQRTLALVIVDLDGFKAVNDTHGHAAGDRILATVGRRLGEIRGADAAFRLGGDEFAVLLPETRSDAAELVARRISRQIRDDTFPHEVSATWGIAEATGPDPEELLAAADRELYARKRDTRSTNSEATG
ncbi:MAG: two-component system, cell cycle response regulator [Solirubrobacteraceae bacterium]|nr:two-component system, cell cycle response regulator [Solirubrobacteraceae bacterium]